jgi:hypothetical protein
MRGDEQDAGLFAQAARDLNPAHEGARRVMERLGQ